MRILLIGESCSSSFGQFHLSFFLILLLSLYAGVGLFLCLDGALPRCLAMEPPPPKKAGVFPECVLFESDAVAQRGQQSPSSLTFTSHVNEGHFFLPHLVSPFCMKENITYILAWIIAVKINNLQNILGKGLPCKNKRRKEYIRKVQFYDSTLHRWYEVHP
jgi:hypothetical protein